MSDPTDVLMQNNPCPRCGSGREGLESECPACRWQPGVIRLPPAEQVIVTLQMLTAAAKTTSISSMFLLTAVVAVCVAVGTQHLELGITASVISMFAIARTSLFVLYSKAFEEHVGLGRKLENFVANFVVMTLFLAGAVFCFLIVCFAITIATHNFILGCLLAFLISLAFFLWLLWLVPIYP